MTAERLAIGVVGCGTAGPAAALFLARAGHAVTLFERVPEPGPVGAGIVLQPTGQAVLHELGLLGPILAHGAKVRKLRCETPEKRAIFDLSYAIDGTSFGLGLHRGALFEVLFDAVKAAKIPIACGVEMERVVRRSDGKTTLVDSGGRKHGPFDLVIVADGARSRLRDAVAPEFGAHVSPYLWGALWFIGTDEEERFEGRLFQIVDGTRRMLGLLPTGFGPRGATERLVTFYWSLRSDRFDEVRDDFDAWKGEVLRVSEDAEPILAQIESPADLTFSSYHHVTMSRWGRGSLVFLGDAAHAMSPQLGQGCNLALYDAMVLAHCIEEAPDVSHALVLYNDRRQNHLDFYQRATRWLTPFFQSDEPWLGWFRDRLMGPMAQLPFFHREMVRSMSGTKLGFVFGNLELTASPVPHLARS
jgi:2-polyprenyl-6-methoxyphenol hydroxylase-like FAD-dependent oxidoreductase